MFARFLFGLIGLCFSFELLGQTLTVSSAGQNGPTFTNISISGNTWTVNANVSVSNTAIQNALANGSLTIIGSTTNFAVNVNQSITSTVVGSDLTIGQATNTGAITISSDITIAGGLVVRGGDVQINSNITSTATGDLFFQGLGDAWSVRLATGKTIEKTSGTGLLTFQGNGRINDHVSVGSILASGSAQLNVVMIAEMDEGTAGTYNISTGSITTNGGKIWMGAGPKNCAWNGFSVGSTGVPGNSTRNGIEITGNISSNGGDILLWSFLGSVARSNGYGDIVAEGANRTINAGSGDIILMTRYNDFADDLTILTVNTTGALILTPASSANFDVAVDFSGTLSSGTFTGSGGLARLNISNFASLGELMVGSYNGTGISGDTPFVFANTTDFNLNSAISLAAKVSFYGGDINLNQSINTTGAAALGDILCKASGDIILAASRSITTSGGDVILWANSDNANSAGAVALRNSSSIVTGSNSVAGGHVWIGGGSNGGTWNGLAVGAGYAVPGTSFTPSNGGSNITAGIYLEKCSISTFGGNVEILGNAAAAGQAITSYGTISIDVMAGTIDIEGNATNSSIANAYGILFGMHDMIIASNITLASSAAGNAITVSGFSRGTEEAIGLSGTLTALSTGTGNIIFNGTSYGSGTAIRIGNYYHGKLNAYAASGSITFNGGVKGLQVSAAQINGITTGPSKLNIGQGGVINSSSSSVIITGDVLSVAADGIAVNTSGPLTIQPFSNSFTNAITYPISNFTAENTITGLTIGKDGNTAGVTIGANQSVTGNINIYAGTITLNGNLTTTAGGNISLYSNNALAGLSAARTINAAGEVTYAPQGTSFATAVTYPITNLTVTCNGLTIGKVGNLANVTVGSTTTIAGPVNIYGGALSLNAPLNTTNTTTGNILLQGTTITGTGNIGLAAGRTVSINVSANSTYAGLISGTGSSLTKLGAGLLTLTNDHAYTGATNINAGDLQVGTGGDLNTASSGTISTTSGVVVANGSKLILSPNDNVTFAAPISGAGGIEIKGTSGSYYDAFITTTPTTFVTNSTVLEVMTRITACLQRGGAISTSTGEVAGAYHKNYNASANTATLQFQQYDGQFTKCVFVRLSQSGSNVQISANTTFYNGAAYQSGNTLGADMSSNSLPMTFVSSSSGAGYGVSKVYMSGKVNFTGALTYTGNTVLSNTVTNGTTPTTHYYVSKGTQEITDASSAFPAASTVVNNGLVIFNRATAITIASNLSGTEEVLQVGAPITLSGTCTHTGLTSIDLNKSLIVGNGSTAGSITGNIVNYGTLTFSRSDNSSYPGIISGSGTLVKSGAGEHTLTGLHTFTGATTISAGKLIISRDVPAFSSTSISGAGELVIQPTTTSFTNALSYPIAGITVNGIGGLTLGKPGNSANITFASTTSVAGPITAYGGTINVNANLTSTLSGADILLEGSKVVQNSGTTVLSTAGDITYTATNTPWTNVSEQSVFITAATAGGTMVNAQGGNISINGSFANTGTNNNNDVNVADVAVLISNSTLRTTGQGTLSINGSAYNNASTFGGFVWGVMFLENCLVQTENGAINITGVGGGSVPNSRGIIADNMSLRILSASGTITLSDAMPAGHTLSNYTGSYFKPASANAIRFGADGSLVTSSSSNFIFDADIVTFDGSPTILTSTGALTIRPVANSFTSALTTNNLTIPSTLTGLTLGKSGNTSGITISSATTINGPITLHGGTLNLNANLSGSNMSFNGSTIVGTPTLTLATGSTLTMNLSSNTTFSGPIVGNNLGFVKNGAGTLSLTGATALNFVDFTISGGTYRLNSDQQLTLSNSLTNNGTFTMRSGATFVPSATVSNISGTGTYNVQRLLTGNAATWSTANTSRFWYMGIPVNSAPRSSFGNYNETSNRLFSYNEVNKQYTNITDNTASLTAGTGYVHRRTTDDTLTFTGVGTNGLRGADFNQTGMTRTSGSSVGFHLVSNPYMAYLDWNAVVANTNTSTSNIESTYYIRSAASGNISALISYNSVGPNYVNGGVSAITNIDHVRYISPLQAFWVRVGSTSTTGSLGMNTGMLSHQTSNPGLKNTTIFPTLARVNLVDGPRFDQMLVFMNQDMINGVDAYDSEKMFVSGNPQIYTMAAGKKLVMNGLNSNKKKISVPLYLELPESKVYNLQLADYNLEDGLILLEDKQEGTVQDFTIHDTYAFYANSGVLQNRFVLHFYAPDATITAQGPSNNWVAEEGSYTEGSNVVIIADYKGKVQISLDQPETEKVEGTVQVTDANGRIVHSGALEGLTTEFQLNVPSGIYYLTVTSGNQIENKKVFIQE